jgi:hypothetical protein
MASDWSTGWAINGRPFLKAAPEAARYLDEAVQWLTGGESLVDHPIGSIIQPPTNTACVYRNPETGDYAFRGIASLSPRALAESHSAMLCDYVEHAAQAMRMAHFSDKFKISVFSAWGEPPADYVLGCRHVDPMEFGNTYRILLHRWKRLRQAVRRKQQRLRFALSLVERYTPGKAFRCRDQRIRSLAQEDPPLVVCVCRDNVGVQWSLKEAA